MQDRPSTLTPTRRVRAGHEEPSRSDSAGESPALLEVIVVVGNGPVGFRFLQGLVEREYHHHSKIRVFGEESRPAYDRVQLTRCLADASPASLQFEPPSWYEDHGIELNTGDRVVRVDRRQKIVHSAAGRMVRYDRLVLATGSRPFLPPIPGIDDKGVFAYRTIDDLTRIRLFAAGRRSAVVLGGGLLGLEAAAALSRLNLRVTVVEKAAGLMPKQLDSGAGETLRIMIEAAGLNVLFQRHTVAIERSGRQLLVRFSNGENLATDIVVVSAGIRPRDELARACELRVGRRGGIVVDNQLRTSDRSIHAIGECAEHNGTVYGLAAPGFQMATTLADHMRGMDATYVGSSLATRLKLVGINVTFSGDYLDPTGATVPVYRTPESYTKLVVRNGRLVGLIGVGEVNQLERLQRAVAEECRLTHRQIQLFRRTGRLWRRTSRISVRDWSPDAVVCSCTGATCGSIRTAARTGCSSVEALGQATNAGTVCGSCHPLLRQLVEGAALTPATNAAPPRGTMILSAVAGLFIALLTLAPALRPPVSVQSAVTVWQGLVDSKFWKQVTGFSLFGLCLLSLMIVVRKRTSFLDRFSFQAIRVFHITIANVALLTLMVHTGFHKGANLTFALFCTFLAASITGAGAAVLTATELLAGPQFRQLRRPLMLAHIATLWPLPVLVTFHIIAVYWF